MKKIEKLPVNSFSRLNMDFISFSQPRVYYRKIFHKLTGYVHFNPVRSPRGRVLVSYVTHPFVITKEELDKTPHTNPFECLDVVTIFLEEGYEVDVIDWKNTKFLPKKKYDIVLDVHQNLERLHEKLPGSTKKIFYITGAHWMYQNFAEYTRLQELKARRNVSLRPRRNIVPANNIEHADYAIALGGNFARSTYDYAKKDISLLPLPPVAEFPSPQGKKFEAIKKNFVWIGGGGAVHKGLDLVLEAFKDLPDYTLTICGPIVGEKDFAEAYHTELFDSKNVRAVGRINVRSQQFQDIVNNSVGLIYPSCSEGQSGSVITALHAGLIPIITHESGVDVKDFGFILKNHSPHHIKEEIVKVSNMKAEELQRLAVKAWEYSRTNHTREIFRKYFKDFLKKHSLI
jgi:glycosyltransferase involved in cell wall biosynthesis